MDRFICRHCGKENKPIEDAILQFIKENQNPKIGLTMDRVAKVMHDEGVCSRPTTLKRINELLRVGVLLDQKRKKNEFHDLIVKE